mgnify:CR=1 FL=1
MKIIFSIFLTLALVSCGEIRLQIGGDDVGEVGEWVWIPDRSEAAVAQGNFAAWLYNTRSGDVRACTSTDLMNQGFDCTMVYSEAKRVIEDGFD